MEWCHLHWTGAILRYREVGSTEFFFHVALRGHEAEGVLIPFCAVFFSHAGGGKMLVPHHLGLQAAS